MAKFSLALESHGRATFARQAWHAHRAAGVADDAIEGSSEAPAALPRDRSAGALALRASREFRMLIRLGAHTWRTVLV